MITPGYRANMKDSRLNGSKGQGRFLRLLMCFATIALVFICSAGIVQADMPVLVKDFNPGPVPGGIGNLTDVNGTLYFQAYEPATGYELWKSDGTLAGTELVKNINPGIQSESQIGNLTDVNGTLFFRANDSTNGTELWKSDGTAAGTVMVKDINPGGDSNPLYLTNVNGTLYLRCR